MGYLYLSVNILFGVVFNILSKVSSTLSKGRILGALYFALLVAVSEIVIFAALNAFRLEFTWISFLYAAVYGLLGTFGTIVGLKAYYLGNMAAYAMVSTSGAIVIPFLFGVLALGEGASVCKWVGCALILCGVAVQNFGSRPQDEEKKKVGAAFILLCIAGACIGGASQCVNKLQSISEGAIDGNSYVVLVQGCIFVYCMLIAACIPKRVTALFREVPALHGDKIFLVAGVYGLVGGLNIVVSLLTNRYLSSAIVFPVQSGMGIVLSIVAGRLFFHERITRVNVISAAIIIAAIAITVLPY